MTQRRLTKNRIAAFDEIRAGDSRDRRLGDLLPDAYKKIIYQYVLYEHWEPEAPVLNDIAAMMVARLRRFVPQYTPLMPMANVISCPLCDPEGKSRGYTFPLGLTRHWIGSSSVRRCIVTHAVLRYRLEQAGLYDPTLP